MAKELNENCPCTASCVRHGNCEACQAHHANGLTTCQRLAENDESK